MAILRLGSAYNVASSSGTYAVPAGDDRMLLAATCNEASTIGTPTMTVGGQSLTRLVYYYRTVSAIDIIIGIFYAKESTIASMSGSTVSTTSTGTVDLIMMQAYENAVQQNPTVYDGGSAQSDTTLTGISVSALAEGVTFGAAMGGANSSGVTWAGTNGLTNIWNGDGAVTIHGTIADRISTANETVNYDCVFTTAPFQQAAGIVMCEGLADPTTRRIFIT